MKAREEDLRKDTEESHRDLETREINLRRETEDSHRELETRENNLRRETEESHQQLTAHYKSLRNEHDERAKNQDAERGRFEALVRNGLRQIDERRQEALAATSGQAMASQQSALEERERQVAEREQSVIRNAALGVESGRALEDRERQLAEREQVLARNTTLDDEAGRALEERERQLAEREQVLARNTTFDDEAGRALEARERQVLEREQSEARNTDLSMQVIEGRVRALDARERQVSEREEDAARNLQASEEDAARNLEATEEAAQQLAQLQSNVEWLDQEVGITAFEEISELLQSTTPQDRQIVLDVNRAAQQQMLTLARRFAQPVPGQAETSTAQTAQATQASQPQPTQRPSRFRQFFRRNNRASPPPTDERRARSPGGTSVFSRMFGGILPGDRPSTGTAAGQASSLRRSFGKIRTTSQSPPKEDTSEGRTKVKRRLKPPKSRLESYIAAFV